MRYAVKLETDLLGWQSAMLWKAIRHDIQYRMDTVAGGDADIDFYSTHLTADLDVLKVTFEVETYSDDQNAVVNRIEDCLTQSMCRLGFATAIKLYAMDKDASMVVIVCRSVPCMTLGF